MVDIPGESCKRKLVVLDGLTLRHSSLKKSIPSHGSHRRHGDIVFSAQGVGTAKPGDVLAGGERYDWKIQSVGYGGKRC
jgi:hypothetical protein